MDSDQRRMYVFDGESGLLSGFEVGLPAGQELVTVLQVTEIDYDPPIDPAVFELELPEDVVWHKDPEKVADNEKYAEMTPTEAARAFFEACAIEDWDEVGLFWAMAGVERLRDYVGGLEVIEVGEPFSSAGYPGYFVPYKIRLTDGTVKAHNLALKWSAKAERYIVDGGI